MKWMLLIVIHIAIVLVAVGGSGSGSSSVDLQGKYLKLDDNLELVYQIPPASQKVKGVLFLAHGCSHSSTDWWPKTGSCEECTGLPVESSIVREGLNRQFAVLALSSFNRVHKCWGGVDISRSIRAIQYLYDNVLGGDYSTPLHLLGGSSGGNFVGILSQNPTHPKVSSLCIQISSMHVGDSKKLPPTMFVIMPKDQFTMRHVEDINKHISQTSVFRAEEKAITPTFFFDHSYGNITENISGDIQKALLKAGMLHKSTLKLNEDPRESSWREVLQTALPQYIPQFDSLIADRSAISELLNMAWAMHEITDEFTKEMFDFFLSHQIQANT